MNFNEYTDYLRKHNLINTPSSLVHLHRATGLAKQMKRTASDEVALKQTGISRQRYIEVKNEEIQGEIALALAKAKHIEDVLEYQGADVLDWLQRAQLKLGKSLRNFDFIHTEKGDKQHE